MFELGGAPGARRLGQLQQPHESARQDPPAWTRAGGAGGGGGLDGVDGGIKA